MRQTASTQKPSDKPQVIAVRFFALALILAHVISFATGSQFWGLCTYPAAWLMMIVFMMVRHWRQTVKASNIRDSQYTKKAK